MPLANFIKATLLLMVFQINLTFGQENIVPNAGFEEYSNYPLGWFYKGSDFSRVIKYWNSPTAASPDIFSPKVKIPRKWADKGFGNQEAFAGKTMVGITTYGCEGGKPHCREYVQIQLTEPLVIGQQYQVRFQVRPIERSLRVNKIGAYFSEEEIRELTDDPLFHNPYIKAEQILAANTWQSIEGNFIAEKANNYILIGNFFPDELTNIQEVPNHLNFGYYYLDEIEVKKMEPIIEVPIPTDDLSKLNIEAGKVVRLNNIFFDHDKSELLPRSFTELNKLYTILKNNPTMTIEIRGHTDAVGAQNYNLLLSERRARAVSNYLLALGINSKRIQFKGYGSAMPVANNTSKEGRQENRRVEFKILSK